MPAMKEMEERETPTLWSEELQGGAMWSRVLPRGSRLRLVDVEGRANVAALFYNADALLERYNMADTLKAQHIARLTQGSVLYSDMGRVLCSIIDDACGWHDPLGGLSTRSSSEAKYGKKTYQEFRNSFIRNGRDSMLIELGKHGLGKRDLVANVNFFSKVQVDEEGNMHYACSSFPGAHVDLRMEMNVLVLLSNTPHPLDGSAEYRPPRVRLEFSRVPLPGPGDACREFRTENGRGFINTERYFALQA